MSVDLKDLGVPGTIGFNVKAKDTKENQKVHDGFREFCNSETRGDYTLGLKVLMDYVRSDEKYKSLLVKIEDLENKLKVLEKMFYAVTGLEERNPKEQEPKKENEDEDDVF